MFPWLRCLEEAGEGAGGGFALGDGAGVLHEAVEEVTGDVFGFLALKVLAASPVE
jgi:hypothetical protein